jgi:hypothetical protein
MSSLTAAGASAESPTKPRSSLRELRGPLLLVLILVALSVALFDRGAGFYRLDLAARVGHKDFRALSPGGPIGHGYGIVGTALILTNLLYLARRRFARWHLGSMRAWLAMHVLTGLFGSVLVVFHSAFQLRSPVATLTSISLGFVVVSGLIGRYFYGLAPQADRVALERNLSLLDRLIPGLGQKVQISLAALPPPAQPRRATLLDAFATVPAWLHGWKARKQLVWALCEPLLMHSGLNRQQHSSVRALVKKTARLSGDPVRAVAGESLLRSWRGLHRFMALLMILSVTGHIVVAWVFGFRWIFSD